MISERTRDKIAAARRKGKWVGGMPILGYTVVDTKLVVDDGEAARVREIFQMYREKRSILEVAKELNARGWRTKSWDACPNPSIPAGEVERFVVDEIKRVGRDSRVVLETLMRARGENEERTDRLKTERAGLTRRLRESSFATEGVADASSGDRRLAESPERLRDAARRMVEIDGELTRLAGEMADETDVAAALADFDDLWASLAPREQLRVVELLVEQVVYNGPAGTVAITFRPTGIRTLAAGTAATEEEAA